MMKAITLSEAMQSVSSGATLYARLIQEPSGDVGFYRPRPTDPQEPHERDEIYVVASGTGTLMCAGQSATLRTGDVIFVPRGAEHRFVNFDDDFATWVILLGPSVALQ